MRQLWCDNSNISATITGKKLIWKCQPMRFSHLLWIPNNMFNIFTGKKTTDKKPMRSQQVINNYYTTYCTTSQIAKMSLWRYSWKEAVNILCKFWVKFNQQIIIKFCATHNTIHASLFFFFDHYCVWKKKVKWEVNFLQDFIH